jgi:apolipoprotein N-acyltransferase
MLQTAAWVGIYGLSFVTVLAASLPAVLGASPLPPISAFSRWVPAVAAMLLILVPGLLGTVQLAISPTGDTGIWLRLVQPSIPQTTKWEPKVAEANFRRLLSLSAAPAAHSITAVVWPEAAIPFLLDRDAGHRREIAAITPERGYVITGALRANPPPDPVTRIWNSIQVVNASDDVVAYYDKTHLVPFGEYIPMRNMLPFRKITAGSIDLSPGNGSHTISLPGLPRFAALICYEAIFPGVTVDEAERPAWILNVTNDAWYGRSSGPYQHLASARTRSVEEGLPMIRVANSGVSAVIDAAGRVRTRIDLDTIGYADVVLPASGGRTLYARVGDWALVSLLLLGALPIAFRLR